MGFFDGGGKSLSFGEVGSEAARAAFNVWRGGVITDVGDAKQATDYTDQSKLRTWPNGDPVMQLPITLDTARGKTPERPESADDDLVRTLYVTKGGAMFAAAKRALKAAGADDFYVGGSLYIRWTAGEGRKGDPRQYELFYEPPVGSSGGFMEEPAPAAAAMPPQQPPAPAFQHPSEPIAAAGGPAPQGYPNSAGPPAAGAGTGQPPQPVWNTQTGQWDLPTPAPAAPPAAPPPPPQPVWNAATGQWEIPASAPAPGQPAPQHGGLPGQGAPPAGPGGVTNPFARR